MPSKRDNFPQKIIERCRARVANRCSNPDCRVPTTGPNEEPTGVTSIGIAAHICAASPGGPRYDKIMTPRDRKGISNAIWLCSNCAVKIDRDPKFFTVEMLNNWKLQAEANAKYELGEKLPDKRDAIDTVSAALTGMSTRFLPDAVNNVVTATANVLEKLDPRFAVSVSHQDYKTIYNFRAKVDTSIGFSVAGEHKKEFLEQYQSLIDHGKAFEIDSKLVTFSGSKLFEKMFSEHSNGKFKIEQTATKNGVTKLWFNSPDKNSNYYIDDVNGKVRIGEKSFSFEGSIFNDLLLVIFTANKPKDSVGEIKFNFRIDFKKWENNSLNSLPYLKKLYDMYEKLTSDWKLNMSLEIDGVRIFKGSQPKLDRERDIKKLFLLLKYVETARNVCAYIGKDVQFKTNFEYSKNEHEKLIIHNNLINEEKGYYLILFDGVANSIIIADDTLNNINNIEKTKDPTVLRFEQVEGEVVNIFGSLVTLPKLSHTFTKVKPKIKTKITEIKPGDEVMVEWIPNKGCELLVKEI